MPAKRISQNFGEFVRMVEQFTHWLTEIDNYWTALQVYRDANNVNIDLPWEPDSNWLAGLSLLQHTVIQATNETAYAAQ